MLRKLLVIGLLTPVALGAQGSGSPEPSAPRTPFEFIIDKLGLDEKTQIPELQKILQAAQGVANPVGAEMVRLRKTLLEAAFAEKTDAIEPALAAYNAAAAKMTGIEADAFVRVVAILKPNQQNKIVKAFPYMAGIFKPAPPRGQSTGRRGGVE